MKIRLWGVRGSLPTPEKDKMEVGGQTTCIEVRLNDGTVMIFDAGTGIIPFGKSLLKEFHGKKMPKLHLFLTHTHWDHIYGFPFFPPAFQAQTEIIVYGPIKTKRSLEELIIAEMDFDYCPVRFSQLPARITFIELEEQRFELGKGVFLEAKAHLHPGGAYSYRVESDGKVFVLNTDTEHYPSQLDERIIHISRNADFMIHDAQYTDQELEHHIGWGHSSWSQSIEVAKRANVKYLGLTHHDPERTDAEIFAMEKEAQKHFKHLFFCREGMVISL